LTDAKGRTASFKNAILIMTSNIGSDVIAKEAALGFSAQSTPCRGFWVRRLAMSATKKAASSRKKSGAVPIR